MKDQSPVLKVWESVVFLQGEEASPWLEYLDTHGAARTMRELCAIYSDIPPDVIFLQDPSGESDSQYTQGNIVMSWNKAGYIGITQVSHASQ